MRTKYLCVDWAGRPRPDGRKFKFRHRRNVKSLYLQVGWLELSGWYGDTSKGRGK